MDIDISSLPLPELRELAQAIVDVLDSRTHKRIHLGDPVTVKGSLSKALKLPDIQRRLDSTHSDRQLSGKNMLAELWETLSPETQAKTLNQLDWYDPKSLSWDDPRSNRYPDLIKKSASKASK